VKKDTVKKAVFVLAVISLTLVVIIGGSAVLTELYQPTPPPPHVELEYRYPGECLAILLPEEDQVVMEWTDGVWSGASSSNLEEVTYDPSAPDYASVYGVNYVKAGSSVKVPVEGYC